MISSSSVGGGPADGQANADGDEGDYLDVVLMAAVAAPGAATDPGAGPLVAALLAELVRRGRRAEVERHLAPVPGRPATYEVRVLEGDDPEPIVTLGDLTGTEALLEVLDQGAAGRRIEVFGRALDGPGRCVLTRKSNGPLVYRFAAAAEPEPAADSADPSALATWPEAVETTAPAPDEVAELKPEELPPPVSEVPEEREEAETVEAPLPAVLVAALRDALGQVTVEVDLGGIEDMVVRAVGQHLDVTPQLSADEVADKVLFRLVGDRRAPRAHDVAEVVAPLLPSAEQVAERVAAHLGAASAAAAAVGATTDQSTGRGNPADPVETALLSGRMEALLERLWLDLSGMADDVRATARGVADVRTAIDYAEHRGVVRTERLSEMLQAELAQLAERRKLEVDDLRSQVMLILETVARMGRPDAEIVPIDRPATFRLTRRPS